MKNQNSNELMHDGVIGMKWGKRNGPPYPLNKEGKEALKEQRKEERTKQKTLNRAAKHDARYKNHKLVNKIRAHQRIERDSKIASAIGSAGVGIAFASGGLGALPSAVLISSVGITGATATSAVVNTIMQRHETKKYKKMLISDPEFKKLALEGKETFSKISSEDLDLKKK